VSSKLGRKQFARHGEAVGDQASALLRYGPAVHGDVVHPQRGGGVTSEASAPHAAAGGASTGRGLRGGGTPDW